MNKLLSRTEFREAVFKRDNYKCVFCGSGAKDAHHIIERRLFPDYGYYIDNGASVCESCHLACERTDYSTQEVRDAAGIKNIVLPEHLETSTIYDKWGNPCLPNGQRLKGELFHNESVQKIIKKHLPLFTDLVKYPRTPHLPWSPGVDNDDIILNDLNFLCDKRVIITEKLDGENTTIYKNHVHARSVDSKHHVSRDWVKQLQAQIGYEIPEGWRLCGENVWAQHSIVYDNLESYFYGFSIWNEKNICLSWDETVEYMNMLNIHHVPVLFDGVFTKQTEKEWENKAFDFEKMEGYVIRIADSFTMPEFKKCVGKYVRKNHVQTNEHWMYSKITKNKLK